MDLKASLEWLAEQVQAGQCPGTVPSLETEEENVVALPGVTGPDCIMRMKKDLPGYVHDFETLNGFLEYLDSSYCSEGKGIVFIGPQEVLANLDYQGYKTRSARLRLKYSEEFAALKKICARPLGMTALRHELIGPLFDSFPAELESQISSVRVSKDQVKQVQIAASGVRSGSSATSIKVVFPMGKNDGQATTELETVWEWHGRFWECFENEYQVEVRMDLDTDGDCLGFEFIPRRLETVLLKARLDLAEKIRGGIPSNFKAYEGVHGPLLTRTANESPDGIPF